MIIEELDEAVDALKEFGGGADKSLHIDSILNEQNDGQDLRMNHSKQISNDYSLGYGKLDEEEELDKEALEEKK